MTLTLREKDPDRDVRGPNGPPAKKNENGVKGAKNGSGPFGPAAPTRRCASLRRRPASARIRCSA
jgi:hypothetical protein